MYALCLFFRLAMNKKNIEISVAILYSLEVQRGKTRWFHLSLREVKRKWGFWNLSIRIDTPPPHHLQALVLHVAVGRDAKVSQFDDTNLARHITPQRFRPVSFPCWMVDKVRLRGFRNGVYNLYKSIQIISMGKFKFWIFQHLQILYPQIYIHMKSKYPPKETESNNWNWNNCIDV